MGNNNSARTAQKNSGRPPAAPASNTALRTTLQANADALRTAGKNLDSIIEYDKVIKLDPIFPYGFAGKGLCLFNLSRHEDAIKEFDKASVLDSKIDWFYSSKGASLHALGRNVEALVECDRAISINNKNGWAHGTRGAIMCALGRFQEALRSCDTAIFINPQNQWAFATRGGANYGLGEYQAALQDGNACIALDKNCAYGFGARAIAYYGLEKHKECIVECDRAIALVPTYFQIYTTKSGSLFHFKRYDEALETAKKAVAISVSCAAAYASIGYILLALERPDEALEDGFLKAVKYDPKYSLAHCGKGTALLRLGRDSEALEAFNESHKLTEIGNQSANMTSATRSIAATTVVKSRADLLKKFAVFSQNVSHFQASASASTGTGAATELMDIKQLFSDAMNPNKTAEMPDIDALMLRMERYEQRFAKVEREQRHIIATKADRAEVSHAIKINTAEELKELQVAEIQRNALLLDYYDAFVFTFSSSYTVAQAILSGKLVLNLSDMKATMAAHALSLIPFAGSMLGSGVTAVSNYFASAKFKKDAARLVKIAPNHSSLDARIEEVARGIVLHAFKKDNILTHAPSIASGYVATLVERCKKFQVDSMKVMDLHAEQFESDAAKLGNMDASFIIDKLVNNKLSISEFNVIANGGSGSDPTVSAMIDVITCEAKRAADALASECAEAAAATVPASDKCLIS